MSHAVLHAEKSSGGSTGCGEHIDRIGKHKEPINVDPERTHLNEQLVEPRSKNMTNDINARIDEGYTKTKALRKDAVKSVRIILSGSHDRMKEIEGNPQEFKAWKEANLKFVTERFGKENIVRMTLHMDEITPHFHCVVVPITFDGGLSCKKMLGGPRDLAKLQTDYAEAMQDFGLSRGKVNSTAKHTDVSEYYGRVNQQKKPFDIELPPFDLSHRVNPSKYIEEVKQTLAPLQETLEKAKAISYENSVLKIENTRLKTPAEEVAKTAYEKGVSETTEHFTPIIANITATNSKLEDLYLSLKKRAKEEKEEAFKRGGEATEKALKEEITGLKAQITKLADEYWKGAKDTAKSIADYFATKGMKFEVDFEKKGIRFEPIQKIAEKKQDRGPSLG
jgi:hypothetical protein